MRWRARIEQTQTHENGLTQLVALFRVMMCMRPRRFLVLVIAVSLIASTQTFGATTRPLFPQPRQPIRTIALPANVDVDDYSVMAVSPDASNAYFLWTEQRINLWHVATYYWPEELMASSGFAVIWLTLRLIARVSKRRVPGVPYCRKCNYRLTGINSQRCPECGAPNTKSNRIVARRIGWAASIPIVLVIATSTIVLTATRSFRASRVPWQNVGPAEWLDWSSRTAYNLANSVHSLAWLAPHARPVCGIVQIDLRTGQSRAFHKSYEYGSVRGPFVTADNAHLWVDGWNRYYLWNTQTEESTSTAVNPSSNSTIDNSRAEQFWDFNRVWLYAYAHQVGGPSSFKMPADGDFVVIERAGATQLVDRRSSQVIDEARFLDASKVFEFFQPRPLMNPDRTIATVQGAHQDRTSMFWADFQCWDQHSGKRILNIDSLPEPSSHGAPVDYPLGYETYWRTNRGKPYLFAITNHLAGDFINEDGYGDTVICPWNAIAVLACRLESGHWRGPILLQTADNNSDSIWWPVVSVDGTRLTCLSSGNNKKIMVYDLADLVESSPR
jgi:hypothetical protein